jgi:thiol-disulfide isomerase/thioredoxin
MVKRCRAAMAVCGLIVSVALGARSAKGQIPEWFGSYRTAADFELRDVRSGQLVKLADCFKPESKTKVVVLVFTAVKCPISDLYMPTLGALAEAYKGRGVQFLAINSQDHDTVQEVADHARRLKIAFPVLKDPGNVVADVNLVERTCEVLVLARMREIRYRGAIDDQYGLETRRDAPAHRYLADALDAILAGRKVATPVTQVAGTLLDRARPQMAAARKATRVRAAAGELAAAYDEEEEQDPIEVGSVTYAAGVAAILQQKCQSCHRPGQVGPFPLLTYDDTVRHAATIREVVDNRRMPPWHADPRYGHFENDRSLSARQRATILA